MNRRNHAQLVVSEIAALPWLKVVEFYGSVLDEEKWDAIPCMEVSPELKLAAGQIENLRSSPEGKRRCQLHNF